MKRCIFAIMAAMLLCGCSIKEEPDTLAVSFFDVGKADSFLMTCGGKNLLMDAGTAKDGKKVAKQPGRYGRGKHRLSHDNPF